MLFLNRKEIQYQEKQTIDTTLHTINLLWNYAFQNLYAEHIYYLFYIFRTIFGMPQTCKLLYLSINNIKLKVKFFTFFSCDFLLRIRRFFINKYYKEVFSVILVKSFKKYNSCFYSVFHSFRFQYKVFFIISW